MLPCFKKMNINAFVEAKLPTKQQIFARTGGKSVTPSGSYTGDDEAKIARCPTEQAENFVRVAESMKEDLPE